MSLPRSSGILLHPTCLPGPFGIGDLGPEAHTFVNFLAAAGQSLWQVLPLGPTGYGDSPYQCLSAFAGNALLIAPELLVEAGLLADPDLREYPRLPADRVDYPEVIRAKRQLLGQAFERFEASASPTQGDRFEWFVRARAQRGWLADWTLFMALKHHLDGRPWVQWPRELRDREPEALEGARRALTREIRFEGFLQFLFFAQWATLRAHCAQNGIRLVGDVPIFVAYDSADVWAHRELFCLDAEGAPTSVAGVPPDFFSEDGQLWGNPLYDWKEHERTRYSWWIE
ncbi:MAG: 4-alpha-glucanotransferase, partial [Cyanobacteria bacterium REEB65]|nr:4-alpha-glucanotransferase [Cyanobacteria bacterium REEB65]